RDVLGGEYEQLTAEAAGWGPGAEGLTFLPYLQGERTPHADPSARGAFAGLSLTHDRGALVRAVLEGVAYGLRDSLELLRGLGVRPASARVSGGGARSDLWLRIVASALGIPLERTAVAEGAAYGAAPLAAVAAVAEAGGVALPFNTIAVSDNQSQGTPGMRASLVSREVIADSIELMVHAHDFDGLVCVVGCDKTTPAALMALARVDRPAVVLYSGPMAPGSWRGRQVTIQDVWEAVGAEERGLATREELDELERHACPGG